MNMFIYYKLFKRGERTITVPKRQFPGKLKSTFVSRFAQKEEIAGKHKA